MKKILLLSLFILLALNAVNAQLNTAGYETWKPLYNSMTTWEDGAFNMNQKGHPDYGWGVYNSNSHYVYGDSVYLVKLQNGAFKQFFIEVKSTANVYSFRHADVTGENEVLEQALCSNYGDKLFLYYSIQNQNFVDREPSKSAWDMVLTRFTDTKINYTVTGFLLNEGSKVSVFHAPDATTALNSTLADTTTFSKDINAIGNSWYKLSGMSIVPLDTMVYFVKTPTMDVYKMQVNFFESGSSMGTGKGRVGVAIQKLAPEVGVIVKDTLVMGNGYANDVFLSMSQGITKESSRSSWDIAFKTTAMTASIITNSSMNVGLYTYPYSQGEFIDAWESLAAPLKSISPTAIYPNPVRDMVTFSNNSWKSSTEVKLMVYNTAGQLILNQDHKINSDGFSTDFGLLPVGLYQVRMINNGFVSTGKILISR